MFHIPRALARQLRVVFAKALGRGRRPEAWVRFHATAEELVVQLVAAEVAVEYRLRDRFESADFAIPLDSLRDCEGKSTDPVAFERGADRQVAIHWEQRGVPQRRTSPAAPEELPAAPSRPTEFADNPPGFLQALADAAEVTDPESSRYALGCVALQGADRRIVATDGRQALVQSGFELPFADEALVMGSDLFACRELPQDQPARIGRLEKHVVLALGPWTIWLRLCDGRFPMVNHIVPAMDQAASRVDCHPSDCQFLLETLEHLPRGADGDRLVTLDVADEIVVRAAAREQAPPTELVLGRSHLDGQPMRLAMNREYLARAVRLGCRELRLYAPDRALLASGDNRQYLWMTCAETAIVPPAANAQRITSLSATRRIAIHRVRIKEKSMPQETPITAAKPAAPRKRLKRAGATAAKSPVEQAIALRDTLRSAAKLAGELAREFKQRKRQARIVESTLESLKSLQKIAG